MTIKSVKFTRYSINEKDIAKSQEYYNKYEKLSVILAGPNFR